MPLTRRAPATVRTRKRSVAIVANTRCLRGKVEGECSNVLRMSEAAQRTCLNLTRSISDSAGAREMMWESERRRLYQMG